VRESERVASENMGVKRKSGANFSLVVVTRGLLQRGYIILVNRDNDFGYIYQNQCLTHII
jgi:hypothetical protein